MIRLELERRQIYAGATIQACITIESANNTPASIQMLAVQFAGFLDVNRTLVDETCMEQLKRVPSYFSKTKGGAIGGGQLVQTSISTM